jgi:hypothetical protein
VFHRHLPSVEIQRRLNLAVTQDSLHGLASTFALLTGLVPVLAAAKIRSYKGSVWLLTRLKYRVFRREAASRASTV